MAKSGVRGKGNKKFEKRRLGRPNVAKRGEAVKHWGNILNT